MPAKIVINYLLLEVQTMSGHWKHLPADARRAATVQAVVNRIRRGAPGVFAIYRRGIRHTEAGQ